MMNQELKDSSIDSKTKIYLFDSAEEFDQHGQAVESFAPREEVRIDFDLFQLNYHNLSLLNAAMLLLLFCI